MLRKRMLPESARWAKAALAERLEKIALGYVPDGWRIVYHKKLSGWCNTRAQIIKVPHPITRKAIAIFLHECAHAHLHSLGASKRPRHVEELEAEQWALAKMRENNIKIPRAVRERAQWHIGRQIQRAERRGAKCIDPRARKFARMGKGGVS